MQNEACYFDEANHIVLLVYVNPVLPKQWSGRRGLPLLTAIVNLLYAAICLHVFKNVKGLCLWQSLHSPSWNMKAMARLYHSTSLPKSSTHREARHILISLLGIEAKFLPLKYTREWVDFSLRSQTKCFWVPKWLYLFGSWPLLF